MDEVREFFIVASSREWHRKIFSEEVRDRTGRWVYVSTTAELEDAILSESPRFIFFLHWNWIVSEKIWARIESIVFHMTDVPYGRGGSPLQNLILEGHRTTVVSALRMVAELDAGPVYGKRQLSLAGTAEQIYTRAAECSWRLIDYILQKSPTPLEQSGEVVRFMRRSPAQSVLPQDGDLVSVYDFIRMLDAPGYPLAFIDWGQFRLSLRCGELDGDELRVQGVLKRKTE